MYQPIFNRTSAPGRALSERFGGLNRAEWGADGEFCDMSNMTSDYWPHLAPCRAPKRAVSALNTPVTCLIAPKLEPGKELNGITGVIGDRFYYKYMTTDEEYVPNIELDSAHELVDFNGTILIFPEGKYYSYVTGEIGDIAPGAEDYTVNFNTSGEDEEMVNTITCSTGFGALFQKGDALTIVCDDLPANSTFVVTSKYDRPADGQITCCVVEEVSANEKTLMVSCYDRNGVRVKFTGRNGTKASISRSIPKIVHACVANNRIFGTDEAGEFIYASALGDFKNWNVFEGLSTDSWYGAVGTEGPFTGLATLGGNVVAFKHNYIHQVYGDSPNNFTIPNQINVGCIDGRSIASLRGTLIFLSYDGIYSFTGGNPVRISDALNTRYTEGVGGSDGRKYYLCGKREDNGNWELAVYDAERGLWHIEDTGVHYVDFVQYNSGFYAATESALYQLHAGDAAEKWHVETVWNHDGTTKQKAPINLYVRARMKPGAMVTVSTCGGDGEWKVAGKMAAEGGDRHAVIKRLPVRFLPYDCYKIRIDGQGDAVIEALERVVSVNGREER